MTNGKTRATPKKTPKRAFIGGFDHALDGIRLVILSQRNMRFHVIAAIAVMALAVLIRVPAVELALLALTISVVFAAEIINTAVEAIVDIASPKPHPLAKTAKDCAAGAVLVVAVGAVFVGVFVFYDELLRALGGFLSP